MKNNHIIMALAAIAGVVIGYKVVAHYKQSKSCANKSGEYSNFAGMQKGIERGSCAVCRDNAGENYHTGSDRNCSKGHTCVTRYSHPSLSFSSMN